MRRILVTGSDGFIGRHVTDAMLRRGEPIVADDRPDMTAIMCNEWRGIIHLAGVSRMRAGEVDPVGCLQANLVLTAALLEAKPDWFVLASTQEPATGSVYGLSKRFAEEYSNMICRKRGISLRAFRLPVVYGDGDNPDKLLPRVFAHVTTGAPLKLDDKALPITYVHVDNVVAAILAEIPNMETSSVPRTISLRDGTLRTKRELMEFAEHVVHSDTQPA